MIDKSLINALVSPCCGSELTFENELHCKLCSRVFATKNNIIELINFDDLSDKCDGTEWLKKMQFRDREYSTKLFDKDAQHVEALYHPLDEMTHVTKAFNQVLASKIKSKFTKNSLLLDVAGGTGYFTKEFAANFDNIILSDLSHQQILSASKTLLDKNISFVRADYLLPFLAKEYFDAILCIDSFLYYPNDLLKNVIKNLLGSLNIGGKFIFDFHTRRFYNKNPRIRSFHKREIEVLLNSCLPSDSYSFRIEKFCPISSKLSLLPSFAYYMISLVVPSYFHVRYLVTVERTSNKSDK